MISRKEARGIIRKQLKRVPEGEAIRHLNIMPMMDIMTILLVAFIYAVNQDGALMVRDLELADSRTLDDRVEAAVNLTATKTGILVQGRPIVDIKNGRIDPSEKKNGAFGTQIPKISGFLGAIRKDVEAELRARGKAVPTVPELFIIADKTTPFQLLIEIIVSSKDAGFRRFRLIVLRGGTKQA